MSPTFQGVLGCIKIKVFASTMIQCASSLKGISLFVPIHCLSLPERNKVKQIITDGLVTIMKQAETKKWNGKKSISKQNQDIIDPFLAALYNSYSIAAGLTDPYQDCAQPPPDRIKFTIEVTYIPEGENDNCTLEILHHDDSDIVIFIWKEFRIDGIYAFLRHMKTTWTLDVSNGNSFTIEYHLLSNRMATSVGELEKTVGWPLQRMSMNQLIDEAKLKVECKLKHLSKKTYKWIQKVPIQYLNSMELDLDEANEDGITLLHILSELDDTKSLKCLLDKVNVLDPTDSFGRTPLHRACEKSSFKVAKLLLKLGANVNAITKTGDSPLTILAAQKKYDVSLFRLMLDCNAKKEHANNDFMRPIDIVKQSKDKLDLVKLLKPSV